MPVIRDVMSDRVVTISADATLNDAARILCENDISGAPVVTETGELVGLIAEPGLIDMLFDEDARQLRVSEYMTREVHAVCPEDSLAEAARLLVLYGIRRLPVVDDGQLVGMVTRRDLLNFTLGTGELLTDPLIELIPWLAPMT
jgi:CBS domain-containing protein